MSALRRPPDPRDPDSLRYAKLTETIAEELAPGVARQVAAVSGDTASEAEEKWQRAVTEGLVDVQRRVGAGGAQFVHIQDVPATLWTIEHNLDGFPIVAAVDSAGTVGYGRVQYLTPRRLTIEFSAGFSGRAYCVL